MQLDARTLRHPERVVTLLPLAIVPAAVPATDADWPAEYLDLTLAVKVVDDVDAAMDHIAQYGSCHTEAIVTSDYGRANRFLRNMVRSLVGTLLDVGQGKSDHHVFQSVLDAKDRGKAGQSAPAKALFLKAVLSSIFS